MKEAVWENGLGLWDLVDFLRKEGGIGGGQIFRGHSNSAWSLIPSIYRYDIKFSRQGATLSELYGSAEQRLVDEFFYLAANLGISGSRHKIRDRIIAQHYGVPTQLLDWSRDPFVSIYFASEWGSDDVPGAIYYARTGRSSKDEGVEIPFHGRMLTLDPPIIDERVKMQKSAFTIQNFGDDPNRFTPLDERRFVPATSYDQYNPQLISFGKVVIPAQRKGQIRFELRSMGVDRSMLFPGLQGIGERISETIKSEHGLGLL